MMALQLARLPRCRIFTTCSPHNLQLFKALGAHEVFDYHNAGACGAVRRAATVRAATGDELLYALDCVAAGISLCVCADALTSRSGVASYAAPLPVGDKLPRKDVKYRWTSGYTSTSSDEVVQASCVTPLLDGSPSFWRNHTPDEQTPTRKCKLSRLCGPVLKLGADLLQQDRLRLRPLVHLRERGDRKSVV